MLSFQGISVTKVCGQCWPEPEFIGFPLCFFLCALTAHTHREGNSKVDKLILNLVTELKKEVKIALLGGGKAS